MYTEYILHFPENKLHVTVNHQVKIAFLFFFESEKERALLSHISV